MHTTNLLSYLQLMVQKNASDMFVTANLAVSAKINGELQPIGDLPLDGEASLQLVLSCMNDKQRQEYLTHRMQFCDCQ